MLERIADSSMSRACRCPRGLITIRRNAGTKLVPAIMIVCACAWVPLLAKAGSRLIPVALFNISVAAAMMVAVFRTAEYDISPTGIHRRWGLWSWRRERRYSLADVQAIDIPLYTRKLVIDFTDGRRIKLSLNGMAVSGPLPELTFDPGVPLGPKRVLLRIKAALKAWKGYPSNSDGSVPSRKRGPLAS